MKTNRAKILSSLAAGVATFLTYGVATADSLYISNGYSDTISVINGSGGSITDTFGSSADLDDPTGVAFDPVNGNLFVANSGNGTISEFTAAGVLVNPDYASGLGDAQGMAFDSSGNLFVASKNTGNVFEVASGGATSIYTTDVTGINDVAFDKAGNLYVSTGSSDGITVTTTTKFSGNLNVIGPALNGPDGLAFDSQGNLYVVNDFDPSVEKIAPGGIGSTLVNGTDLSTPRGIALNNAQTDIYVVDQNNGTVSEYNILNGDLVNLYTGFCGPNFIADLPSGSLPIPEPSTYALLLGGVGALYFFNRRRKLATISA
jgi:DNA-binding beta-propeller fold protein YncE